LKKFGGDLVEIEKNTTYKVKKTAAHNPQSIVSVHTYDDHRMAMAFAPLAMLMDVVIEEPNVVVKSYPSFWEDINLILNSEF
jgi:3-phosphoshikimate 1-carboxyvinyltransferase